MDEYWGKINVRVNLIFGVKFDVEPQFLPLSLPNPCIKASNPRSLFHILTKWTGTYVAQIN